MKVLVGSQNPIKIESAREAFSNFFSDVEVEGIEVNSGVPAQPKNEEIFEGAKNRAESLKIYAENNNISADYFVGIEGGIEQKKDLWFSYGGMCIINKKGEIGFGASPLYELPTFVVDKLLNGIELGDVMDELAEMTNSKQKIGAIGFFTNGIMKRKDLYVPGLIVAIVPFLHPKLYFQG